MSGLVRCMKNKGIFLKLGFVLILLLLIFFVISFFSTAIDKNLFSMSFCFRSDCINFFVSNYSGLIHLFKGFSFFFALIAAIVACMAYQLNSKVFRFDMHISNFKIFNDVLIGEISKNSLLSGRKFNGFSWYKLLYPNSLSGDLNLNAEYPGLIDEIISIIEKRNGRVRGENREPFNYKEHQTEFIKVMSKLGIDCERLPSKDFSLVQTSLIVLINNINSFFTLSDKKIPNLEGV